LAAFPGEAASEMGVAPGEGGAGMLANALALCLYFRVFKILFSSITGD